MHKKDEALFAKIDRVLEGHDRQRSTECGMPVLDGPLRFEDEADADEEILTRINADWQAQRHAWFAEHSPSWDPEFFTVRTPPLPRRGTARMVGGPLLPDADGTVTSSVSIEITFDGDVNISRHDPAIYTGAGPEPDVDNTDGLHVGDIWLPETGHRYVWTGTSWQDVT